MLNTIRVQLPPTLQDAVEQCIARATADHIAQRIWQRDATVWTNTDESRWLGWLEAPTTARQNASIYTAFAKEIRGLGLSHVLLLGMGGSSLAPEVLGRMLPAAAGSPRLLVLDSTHPDQIRAVERQLDLYKTLVIASSKSGSTLETKLLGEYWFERLVDRFGPERAGEHMIAVTDPDSQLEATARQQGFRRVFAGDPTVGGRFSALSPFGLVPSIAAGHDVQALLGEAIAMADACRAGDRGNPGLLLGAVLGEAARAGRDKLTLVTSRQTRPLGAWLEQLLAESTGKNGKAIIPIDAEPLGRPDQYGPDRLFVGVTLDGEHDPDAEHGLDQLVAAGHPVVRIRMRGALSVAQEFFRWEFATAVAGAVMGVNPFDQPDVEASKIATRRAMAESDSAGAKTAAPSIATEHFGLVGPVSGADANGAIGTFLASANPGDYVAVLAYVQMNAANAEALTRLRDRLRARLSLPISIQFGPRFLHSTGQAHKGGPNTGLFLVLTDSPQADLPATSVNSTFGAVVAAQALGDSTVLTERGRRVMRVQLRIDAAPAIDALSASIAA